MDSLLVNVSGHLLLLSPYNKESADSDDDNQFQVGFTIWVLITEKNFVHTYSLAKFETWILLAPKLY